MIKLILSITIFISILNANDFKRGEKIYNSICDSSKLKGINLTQAKEQILSSKACQKMSDKNLQALISYLTNKNNSTHLKEIKVPKKAACPVCGMWVAKYPKWVALISTKDEKLYFDGVKDMMKFYLNPKRFHHNKIDPTSIKVTDYYSLNAIDAKKAYYVIGSNIYGPMGEELIPFFKLEDAKAFKSDHDGKKIIRFDEIDENMLYE